MSPAAKRRPVDWDVESGKESQLNSQKSAVSLRENRAKLAPKSEKRFQTRRIATNRVSAHTISQRRSRCARSKCLKKRVGYWKVETGSDFRSDAYQLDGVSTGPGSCSGVDGTVTVAVSALMERSCCSMGARSSLRLVLDCDPFLRSCKNHTTSS